jgi:hypothetical protein
MRYQHPDLDEITTFLQGTSFATEQGKSDVKLTSLRDFGMSVVKRTDSEVWYRGYGKGPYVYYARKGLKEYLGGTFQVQSYDHLERRVLIEQ